MVIAVTSIVEVLFLLTIIGFCFCLLNQLIQVIHHKNKGLIHRTIKKDVIILCSLMAIVWINASVLTLKNVGTFLYEYPQIGYTIVSVVAMIFIVLLQGIWKKVVYIIKSNVRYVNHSDTVKTLNRWRNKK